MKPTVLVTSGFGIGNTVAKLPLFYFLKTLPIDVSIFQDIAGKGVIEFFIPAYAPKIIYFDPHKQKPDAKAFSNYEYVIFTQLLSSYFSDAYKTGFFGRAKIVGLLEGLTKWDTSEAIYNVHLFVDFCAQANLSTLNLHGFPLPFVNMEFPFPHIKIKETIGVHTGCDQGWMQKRWSTENWNTFIRMLDDNFGKIYMFGKPGDFSDMTGARVVIPKKSKYEIVSSDDRQVVFDKISKCEYFVSGDSGLAKVAIASGCKTLSLFGPTDPLKNRLWNEKILTLKTYCAPCQYSPMLQSCRKFTCMQFKPASVLTELMCL